MLCLFLCLPSSRLLLVVDVSESIHVCCFLFSCLSHTAIHSDANKPSAIERKREKQTLFSVCISFSVCSCEGKQRERKRKRKKEEKFIFGCFSLYLRVFCA